MSVKDQVLKKAEELGEAAPKFFGYAAKTIESWKKKPNTIPLRAVEKVLNQNGIKSEIQPKQDTPPEQATIQSAPPYTIGNAQADIFAIVKHFNETVSPVVTQIKNQGEVNAKSITQINEQLRELMAWKSGVDRLVPSQQQQAPTVGQLLAASQPSDQFNQLSNPNDLPSRLRPADKAQVIAEYNPPTQSGNGHPLDTGVAPSAEDRARSLNALADRQDPRNPGRPAGPATPPPQDAPGMPGWTKPWPVK